MSTVPDRSRIAEQQAERLYVHGSTWDEYLRLVDLFAERHVRLSYDGRTLEMAKSTARHERRKIIIGGLIDELAGAWDVSLSAFGGATFYREDLQQGIDPDLSYYRAPSCKIIREGRNPKVAPPPDLVVELDVTDATGWRLSIFAALGTPEVWRFDGHRVTILTLEGAGYVESQRSPAFPIMNATTATSFVREIEDHDGSDRAWRARVHERVVSLNSPAEG